MPAMNGIQFLEQVRSGRFILLKALLELKKLFFIFRTSEPEEVKDQGVPVVSKTDPIPDVVQVVDQQLGISKAMVASSKAVQKNINAAMNVADMVDGLKAIRDLIIQAQAVEETGYFIAVRLDNKLKDIYVAFEKNFA